MKTKLTLLRRTIILGLVFSSSLAITLADDTTAAKAQPHLLAVNLTPLVATDVLYPHLLAPAIDLFGSAGPAQQVLKLDTDNILGRSQSFDSLLGVAYTGPMLDDVLGVTPAPVTFIADFSPSIADASIIAASR